MTDENSVYQPELLKRMLKVIAGVVNAKREKYSNTLAFADAVVKDVIDRKFPDHLLARLLVEKIREREEIENRRIMHSSFSQLVQRSVIESLNKGQVDLLGEYHVNTPVFFPTRTEMIPYRLLLSFGLEVINAEKSLFSKEGYLKGDPEELFSNIYQNIMDTLSKLPPSDRITPTINGTASACDLVIKLLHQIPDSLFVRMNLSLTFGEADSSNYLSRLSAVLSLMIKKMIAMDGAKTATVCESFNAMFELPQLTAKRAAVTKPSITKTLRFFNFLSSPKEVNSDSGQSFKENLRALDSKSQQCILMNMLMDAYGQITALANVRNVILKLTTQCMPAPAISTSPLHIAAVQAAASSACYAESPRLSDFQITHSGELDRFTQLTKDFSHPSLVTVIHGTENKLEITDITWEADKTEELSTHVKFFQLHVKEIIKSFTKLHVFISSSMKEAECLDKELLTQIQDAKTQLQLVSDQLDGLSQLASVVSSESAPMAQEAQSCPALSTPGR